MRSDAAAPRATIDHLVLAAATLADGIDYVASVTGVAAKPGGKHVAMGTHNALMRLGDRLYLEIIAIDPGGEKPKRPRWFGLDQVALQSELTESPRLVHWVARTSDIHGASQASGIDLGRVHAMTRGDFRWRITIPDDGSLPARGLVPTLIQWDVPMHPTDRLPECNVSLIELAATHPDPNTIRHTLRELGLQDVLHVSYDRETRLCTMLRTPNGIVTLSS